LEYLGITVRDVRRNQLWLEENGWLAKSQVPGCGRFTLWGVRKYEEELFKYHSWVERAVECLQEFDPEIEVPVVGLYVFTGKKSLIPRGAAIIMDTGRDIGATSEAPFPVTWISYEANPSGLPHLSRFIERAIAANADLRKRSETRSNARMVCADDLTKVGWLDLEYERIEVEDRVALQDWLGVDCVSENELSL
jgi:hypothetical protein